MRVSFLKYCLCLLVSCFTCIGCAAEKPGRNDWLGFKSVYISRDGRVIDTGQQSSSHSEGQGYGMVLATSFDDAETFDLLWQWTQANLQVREDRLLAWHWAPGRGVTDLNNASDGDVLVVWALLRAYEAWGDTRYHDAAIAMLEDIRGKLIRTTGVGPVLLPGIVGFIRDDVITINLSYWIFPALRDFARHRPNEAIWQELLDNGHRLLAHSRYGEWHLPPDWTEIRGVTLEPTKEQRFGYDAIRIPLYMIWNGQGGHEHLASYRIFWGKSTTQDYMPAWVSLLDGVLSPYSASPGMRCVSRLVADATETPGCDPASMSGDYYSAVLTLLANLASTESTLTGQSPRH